MPPQHAVLSAVGPDRPGIVDRISALIHDAGGNIADSRMSILGDTFALVLLFSGSPAAVAKVKKSLGAAAKKLDLTWALRPAGKGAKGKAFLPYRLNVTGLDHPGIVHRVSAALAGQGINVAALDPRLTSAPMSGSPLFVLEADLQVPTDLAAPELRRALDRVCSQETLDYTLEMKA